MTPAALLLVFLFGAGSLVPCFGQSPTFAGNAQHTAQYSVPAQHLNRIRWSTTTDLDNGGAFAHYGAPLITSANTVIVPVRTATGFIIRAFEGATGRLKYTLTNDYIPPTLQSGSWFPVYQPVIATPPSGLRLYYAGAGGTIYYIENPDGDASAPAIHQCFYTNLNAYASNATAYNSNIVINTPLTAAADGVVFFGFRVQGTASAPLNTTNSGFVRVDPTGNATYVLAGPAAGDSLIYRDSHNCAPALSNDGATLYVVVKSSSANYAYLLGLDATTLATKYKVLLHDPRSGNYAGVPDNGTASPMVAPDGDVFFGVFAEPNNASRGFLLHFSGALQLKGPPSAFGWDYTPAIIPSSMVPSYTGNSAYLLFSKYNNYAGGDGNGINRIALVDPNATQIDPHLSAGGLAEMREVLTVIGPTTDAENYSSTYTNAVREWCINTAGVNPATKSVFAPSEDGRIYRWDLAANAITEVFTLSPGVGEPYVPTEIGPDGTVYAMNGGGLFALGSYSNVSLTISSSAPDLRNSIVGQPITFTAVVTNENGAGPAPTGTVTFREFSYAALTPLTNILAANVPLIDGAASVTASSLFANGTNFGNHFVTAIYSGDGAYPATTATLLQKIHASATTTLLSSSANASHVVTLTASVACDPPGTAVPSGMVSFWDWTNSLGQIPLDTNGLAVLRVTNWPAASHSVSATYASDTFFAASSGSVMAAPQVLTGLAFGNGSLHFAFSNTIGAPFSVFGSADLSLPLSAWTFLGAALESSPGQFQFNDAQPATAAQKFYRVGSP